MTRQILYVAAPLRPTEGEIEAVSKWAEDWDSARREPQVRERSSGERHALALKANLTRAMRWLAWLRKSFPETTFIAPWIASVLAGADDADPSQREHGMLDAFAVLERCDGIVLCGGRISEGMRREMVHAPNYFEAYDLTRLGGQPPLGAAPWLANGPRPSPMTFAAWGKQ